MTSPSTTGSPQSARTGVDLRTGLPIALVSAAAFGMAGPLASPLLASGWSPAAVVIARVGGASLALLIPCLMLIRRIGLPSGSTSRRLIGYGIVAVAGGQLCYYSAIRHLPVGMALLLEYLAPVLLIGWHWWRRGQRPTGTKLLGAGLSMIGLALVLDLTSEIRIDVVGVAWALGAALCLCGYFIMSENAAAAPPPLLLTGVGTAVGAIVLALAGLIGIVPLAVSAAPVTMAGHAIPWWAPILTLALVSAALAYLSGIEAVRRLGSSIASFVALTEVILAVIFAALLLGQIPTPIQVIGGVLILIGIAVVQTPPGTLSMLTVSRSARRRI